MCEVVGFNSQQWIPFSSLLVGGMRSGTSGSNQIHDCWSAWLMHGMVVSTWKLGTILKSLIVDKKISSSRCWLVVTCWCSSFRWVVYFSLRIKSAFVFEGSVAIEHCSSAAVDIFSTFGVSAQVQLMRLVQRSLSLVSGIMSCNDRHLRYLLLIIS